MRTCSDIESEDGFDGDAVGEGAEFGAFEEYCRVLLADVLGGAVARRR